MQSALIYRADIGFSDRFSADMERHGWMVDTCRGMLEMLRLIEEREYEIVVLNAVHMDVEIYALEGKKNRALAALRLAIDEGWRVGWWRARSNLNLELLHDEPDFQALLAKIETDMAAQREALRATQ